MNNCAIRLPLALVVFKLCPFKILFLRFLKKKISQMKKKVVRVHLSLSVFEKHVMLQINAYFALRRLVNEKNAI